MTSYQYRRIKVPPINLWNINEVWYLFWRYAYLVDPGGE